MRTMTGTTTFGIDLGTTHSCIAYIGEAGRPVIVKSANNEDTTPSVVYFQKPEDVVVGNSAKNAAVLAPHNVASLVKRDMGRQDVSYRYHDREYTPEEISALILRELVQATEENTGLTVRDVVITVPAGFGIAEREATRRAGTIAGLNVLDVLDEPVAAALHYQATSTGTDVRHLLVCDLGGGTFDTTVIRVEDKNITVVCTKGDQKLGGADWDARVRDHLLAAFRAQHPRLDPSADEEFMQDITIVAEQLKKDLSSTMSRRTDLRFRGAVAKVELTRAQLEELTADLLDRVVDITRRTVELAKMKGVDHFDGVFLVGGMSRMPAVAARLRDRLGLGARLHEPDLAVAKGAALYAVIHQVRSQAADHGLTSISVEQAADRLGISTEQVQNMAGKRVAGVLPRAFGVMGVDPKDPQAMTNPLAARKMIAHLLFPGTALPADSGPYPFAVAINNQRMVEIEVWEQTGPEPSEELADNLRIGRGMLRNLPPRPAGSPFEISFQVSETGRMTVHAREPESGAQVRFDLQIGGLDAKAVDSARVAISRHHVTS